MTTCFVTQRIDPAAIAFLEERGIAVRQASRPAMEAVMAEVGDARAVITRDLGFDERALAAAAHLRIIACHGSGTNRIAVAAARARGVLVTRAVNTNDVSVAELTIGLMLAAARRLVAADRAVRGDAWHFRYDAGGVELRGRTLGLVGFGAIAREVARIARAGLGMEVAAWSPRVPDAVFAAHGVRRLARLEALLEMSDVLSLHRPGDAEGAAPLGAAAIARLRPGALLINTSRGGAVDPAALRAALLSGHLGGAALDVLPDEPPAPGDLLLDAPGLILTPHIGAATAQALRRMAMLCAHQVCDALAGRVPDHLV